MCGHFFCVIRMHMLVSHFPSIVQHRVRRRVWYNCYSDFVQDLTFVGCLQSDCRTRKKNSCVKHMLKRNNTYECDYEQHYSYI